MAQVVSKLATVAKNRIQPSDGITKKMATAGKLLLENLGAEGVRDLAAHPSDTVRGWVAYLLTAIPDRCDSTARGMVRPHSQSEEKS